MSTPALPFLSPARTLEGADWIRAALTTFGQSVASFVPSIFEAYARVYHPWQLNDDTSDPPPTWAELAAAAGVDRNNPVACESLIWSARDRGFVEVGCLPRDALDPLVEQLRVATTTPEDCWFALWEGFAGCIAPPDPFPKLALPNRSYHVYRGPIEGARTSHSKESWIQRSPNLWWPSDHAWCVATEVDHAWSYIGATRSCIDALLSDPRFEGVETTADAIW
jgi:hypothetical protein